MAPEYDVIVKGNALAIHEGYLALANATLVETSEGPLLFDTGHFGVRPALVKGLEHHGLAPGDLKYVFLSHLHYDHCQNVDLFPDARIFVSREEWDYVVKPDPEDIFVPWLIREQLESQDLELIEGEGRIGEGLRYIPTPGHTPGCYSLVLETGDEVVVLAGDAIHYVKEIYTGTSEMYFGSENDAAASISLITSMADRIVPGHFPELIRRGDIFTWDEPSELNLVIR
jgi:N-acyl homoserine lactone hydrolase